MSKLIKVGVLISGRISNSVKRSTDTAVKNQGRVGSAISKVNAQLGHAKQARKYGRLLNNLKKKQRALGHSSKRLDRGIEDVQRRYNEARRAASRYGSELGDVERKTRKLGDTQRRQKGGFSKGQVGAAIGAAGGAAITAGVISAGNREEEGLYLRTVINTRDGDKDAAVGRSRVGARAFARKSLADEREIIEIEYALNSAGLEEEVSRAGARMVHKVAKITKGQSGQVGEIIGTTFNNLGDQMVGTAEEKMMRIGNILTKTQFKFAIRDFGQLGASMEYGLATAASYKISLEQTATAIGFLNNKGYKGSRAGTSFAAMMRNMTKAGDELGFSMIRNTDGSLDFMATVKALGESMDGLGIDEKADLIGKIFGDEGKGAVIAMINDLEGLEDGYKAVNEAANGDLVNEEYARFLETSIGQWRMLRQNIGQTAVTIGTALLPVINAVGKPIGKLMGWVAWGIENIPGVGLVIGLLGTTVVLLGTAMAATATAHWAWNAALAFSTGGPAIRMIGLVGTLSTALWGLAVRALPAVIIGIRALGVALLTNPIGLIITGIAVGAFLLIKFWKPISGFFIRTFGAMKAPALATWNVFKALFKWSPIGLLVRGIGGAIKWVIGIFGGPRKAAKAAWAGLKTIMAWSPFGLLARGIGAGLKWISGKFGGPRRAAGAAWKALKTIMAWSPIGLLVRGLGAGLNWISGIFDGPRRAAAAAWTALKTIMAWSPIGLLVRGLGSGLNWISGIFDGPRKAAAMAWAGIKTIMAWSPAGLLARGLGAGLNWISGKFPNPRRAAKAAWSGIKTIMAWSPTGLLARSLGTGLKWISGKLPGPRKAAGIAWGGLKTIMAWSPIGLAKRAWDGLPSVFDAVLTRVKGMAREGMDYVGGVLTKPIKMVQGLWNKIRGIKKDAATIKVGGVVSPVGAAVNDNFNPANAPLRPKRRFSPQRRVGAAYGELNHTAPGGAPAAQRAPLRPPAISVAAPVTTHHVREGDTNTYVFHGVLDGEEAVRKLEPHLKRREQENREADLHD